MMESDASGRTPTVKIGGRQLGERPVPDRLGPYRILDRIGQGSFGVVYRARHDVSGEMAALKTLAAPDPVSLWDMRREVQILAGIRHPGIVRILGDGLRDEIPWYAMELLDGPTLRSWVCSGLPRPSDEAIWWTVRLARGSSQSEPASGPAPGARPKEVPVLELSSLKLVARLCRTLAYLHGEGLVHRDLKPENVVVRNDEWPVLVDFGLVEQFRGEKGRDSLSSWSVGGTANYLAPEQWQGKRVDARADLYSLGCILYELLAGRPPFVGSTVWKVLQAHVEEEPVPPSRHGPGIPAELDQLVLQLLAKQPRDRIGHADDIAEALHGLGVPRPTEELPPTRPYLYRSDLVGREQERERLSQWLERACAGEGGLVVLEGESGVGKTRLALELAVEAEGLEALVLAGECRSEFESAQPLAALRRPLEAFADLCRDPDSPETLPSQARVLAPFCPELTSVPGFDQLPEPAALPAEASRLRVQRELAKVVGKLADRRTVLLVLDDLQWADELSLRALDYFERNLGNRRLLVMCCRRSDVASPLLDELSRRQRVLRLHLARLEDEAVGRLASEMLAHEAPDGFVRFLARKSEGNPYFVAQYLGVAVEQGVLVRRVGGWSLVSPDVDLDGLPLPETLDDLIGQKLDGLPAHLRALLDLGAVLGRTVEAEILADLAGDDAGRGLDELVKLQCLERAGEGQLRFPHDRLRQLAYESISVDRRPAVHRAAAEVLLTHHGEKPDRQGEIGRHFAAAGDTERARPLLLEAARHAKASHATREAERLYRSCLEILSVGSMERIVATRELCEAALRPLERLDEARRELEAALEQVRGLNDVGEEARLVSALGLLADAQDRTSDAQRLIERSIELATRAGDRQQVAISHVNLGAIHHGAAAYDASEEAYRTALSIAREIGDDATVARALGNLANTLADAGRREAALELYESTLAWERQRGNRWRQAIVLVNLATTYAEVGTFREDLFEESLRLTREIDHRRLEGTVLGNLGQALAMQGRVEPARMRLSEALEITRELGARRLEANWLLQLGSLLSGEDLSEAERLTSEAVAIFRDLGDRPLLLQALMQATKIRSEAGGDARDLFRQCRDLAEELALPPEGNLARALEKLEEKL